MLRTKILALCFLFIILRPASGGIIERARQSENIRYAQREYFNYNLLLQREKASDLPSVNLNDILLDPNAGTELTLHPGLLERMYGDNMRRVFFIIEISPYYPGQKYDVIPWGGNRNYTYFGNAFWSNPGYIKEFYRRIYGTAAEDFNSQMQRIQKHRNMENRPQVFVFAELRRTGADSQWKNVWGWDYYYYFEGREIYMP